MRPGDPGYEAWIESKAGAQPNGGAMSTPEDAVVIVSPRGMYHLKSPGLDARPRCAHYTHQPESAVSMPVTPGWHSIPLSWAQVLDAAQFHGTPAHAAKNGQYRVCNSCWLGRWEKRV